MKHPLYLHFCNSAAWTNKWAIWFADLLHPLKEHADFPRLIEDLNSPDRYGERMSILLVLELLISAGFSFSLDKQVDVSGVGKKPDIFVQPNSNAPGFYIEVSSLRRSQKEREASDVFHSFTEKFLPFTFNLTYSGRIERVLSKPHLLEVLGKAEAAAHNATHETGFETIENPGVIHIAFATKSNEERLKSWAESRGLDSGEFRGPPVHVNEFDRISFKLEKELKQLPTDRSNVVVIYSPLFENPPQEIKQFEKIIHSLEDEVFKFAQVGYLALVFMWTGGNPNQVLTLKDHICVSRCRFDFNCDAIILLKNRFASPRMPKDADDKFRAAFIKAI